MSNLDTFSRHELITLLQQAYETITALQARVAALEEQLSDKQDPPASPQRTVPSFVKPSAPTKEKEPRKKRSQSFVRRREQPTEVVEHFAEACSECGRRLEGGWVHSSRQVIEIPQAPVRVIEHRQMARHCGVCARRELGRMDLSDQVVGQSRLGVGLMSLIGYLDTLCRMPVRSIQQLLSGLYGLHLSVGEITGVLHTVAARGAGTHEALLGELRQSEMAHADETGARENGQNGYVWSFSTPTLRYYVRRGSRSGEVAREVLEGFEGALVSDFYSGYHWYRGPHQYCWVHLLRDLKKLQETHPKEPSVALWVKKIKKVYTDAKAYQHESVFARQKARRRFQRRLLDLARPYLGSPLPQQVLAERIKRHLWGLFVFVEWPEVPADNNAAERAIRPFVVLRKVSGGTRSKQGSDTQAVLLSLFGTWMLRGQDTLQTCRQMLLGQLKLQPG